MKKNRLMPLNKKIIIYKKHLKHVKFIIRHN